MATHASCLPDVRRKKVMSTAGIIVTDCIVAGSRAFSLMSGAAARNPQRLALMDCGCA